MTTGTNNGIDGATTPLPTSLGGTGQNSTATFPTSGTIGVLNVVNVSSASQAMSSMTKYINSNAAQVTYTLPTTSVKGDVIEIDGTLAGAGGWTLTWTTNQYAVYNTNKGTTTTGSITSTNQYNCLRLVCTVDNLAWVGQGGSSLTVA